MKTNLRKRGLIACCPKDTPERERKEGSEVTKEKCCEQILI